MKVRNTLAVRAGVFGAFILTFFALFGFSLSDLSLQHFRSPSALSSAGKGERVPIVVARETLRLVVSSDLRDPSKSGWHDGAATESSSHPFAIRATPESYKFGHGRTFFRSSGRGGYLARAPPFSLI